MKGEKFVWGGAQTTRSGNIFRVALELQVFERPLPLENRSHFGRGAVGDFRFTEAEAAEPAERRARPQFLLKVKAQSSSGGPASGCAIVCAGACAEVPGKFSRIRAEK